MFDAGRLRMFRKNRVKKANVSIPRRKWKTNRLNHKDWDSTVSDLTVYKASEEEIQRRRLIHKSKNASAARRALGERAKRLFMDPASPGQVELEMKKLAILKEVLFDHDDLNEVLNRVDNTMSSVKTIFHGAPYRKSANPNVTLAPGSKTAGPVPIREESATQMSLLSDSVMDKRALNEEESSSDEEEEEKFESKLDYERFLNVLKESLNKSQNAAAGDTVTTPKAPGFQALNCTEEVKRTMTRLENPNPDEKGIGIKEDSSPIARKIDDTITKLTIGKGGKNKNQSVSFSLVNDSSTVLPPKVNLTTSNMTYENIQDAMESVVNNIAEMENRRGGKSQSVTGNISLKSDDLAGFTATLIDAVTRLTVYVNEAEGKLSRNEVRIDELKSQNDHQRALIDALTAELMSTQDLIKDVKESFKLQAETAKENEDFKNLARQEINTLTERVEALEGEKKEAVTGAGGDAASNLVMKTEIPAPEKLETDDATEEKRGREEALKSDMLSLLGALKSQDLQVVHPQEQHMIPMNNTTSKGAAQTVASVESQLRHLQLQHAEAQNRLQELTEVAGYLAGKVAESRSESSASRSGHDAPSVSGSSTTPSIVSGPITPHDDNNEFQPMIPSNKYDETDDSAITITSSMFANVGGDTARPSIQSSAFSNNAPSPLSERRILEDSSSLKSSDRVNISDDSFHELEGRRIPTLLQTNIYGMSGTSEESSADRLPAERKQQSSLPSFKPTGVPTMTRSEPQDITNSIQQTQYNLEDRIAELNRQHAEAQARLHSLIRKRTDGHSPSPSSAGSRKVIQVSLPTEDMFKTPQVHKAPEQFKPMNLADGSFL